MDTPFVFGKIATGGNFTDREEETKRLENNFNYCINTILISPRRWGKSSLVHKAAALACSHHKDLRVCYIDLFNVMTVEDFYVQYATSVIKATSSKWEEFVQNAKKYLSALVPKVTLNADVGADLGNDNSLMLEATLSLDMDKLSMKPDDVLDLPEKIAEEKGIKIAVCIDDFQKIGEWKDSAFLQGKFRSKWQHHQHVGYCLYGSKRHMMLEIFTDSSKPFYRFGDIIFLQKIPREEMTVFIKERFRHTGKAIEEEAASLIPDLLDNHPYYCQQLAQLCWLRTQDVCSSHIVAEAHKSLVEQLSLIFTNLTEELTVQQLNYLKALLNGEENITSARTLSKYGITSATSASRSKATLISKDILDNIEGKVRFLDPVYEYWLRHAFFKIRL